MDLPNHIFTTSMNIEHMVKNNRLKVFIILILSVAFIFRIFNLVGVPPHVTLDEATTGYNAYSILKTGADEYGTKFPVLLRAYDDYRPALYTYLVIPFVKLFGLNVLAVRLPSAILSIIVILSVFFLIRCILVKDKRKDSITLITMLFLALSPWHIYISRLGHEVNLFFSLFIFAITLFYLFINYKNRFYLVGSSMLFALSFASYQSGKIFIPIIILSLGIIYYKDFIHRKILVVISIAIFVIVIVPTLVASRAPNALIRFQATNIFTMAPSLLDDSAKNIVIAKEKNDIVGQLINNRRFVYVSLPVNAYISHLNPFWLFSNGPDEPFKAPFLGLFYPYDLLLMLLGILILFRKPTISRRTKIFILIWCVSSIVPGAITTGFPHAMRIFQILPIPHLFMALGLVSCLSKVKIKNILIFVVLLYLAVSSILFYKSYFEKLPLIGYQFQYGVDKALNFAITYENEYDKIYISNSGNLFESYMFYLFLSKFDPAQYQHSGGTISGGYAQEHKIGKFNFVDLSKHKGMKGLIIQNPSESFEGVLLSKIYFLNGRDALWIVKN